MPVSASNALVSGPSRAGEPATVTSPSAFAFSSRASHSGPASFAQSAAAADVVVAVSASSSTVVLPDPQAAVSPSTPVSRAAVNDVDHFLDRIRGFLLFRGGYRIAAISSRFDALTGGVLKTARYVDRTVAVQVRTVNEGFRDPGCRGVRRVSEGAVEPDQRLRQDPDTGGDVLDVGPLLLDVAAAVARGHEDHADGGELGHHHRVVA